MQLEATTQHGPFHASSVEIDRMIEQHLFTNPISAADPIHVWTRHLQDVAATYTGMDFSGTRSIIELLVVVADITRDDAPTR